MRINVGIDSAKDVHWITAIDPDGEVRIDRKLSTSGPSSTTAPHFQSGFKSAA